jgi:hypothetical protein
MNYAATEITFIDRETETYKVAYAYPVTKVILRERDNPANARTFVVNDDGIWEEDD